MTILYYTGTGNSLAVAKGFNGKRISIPKAMNQKAFTLQIARWEGNTSGGQL